MKYCTKCGHENEDDGLFCVNCGNPFEETNSQSTQKSVDDFISAGKDVADKVASGAKKAMKQVTQKIEKQKEKINKDVEKMSERYETERKEKMSRKEVSGSEYMSKTELWSWLKRQLKREKYFTEEKSNLTFKDFIEKVNMKLKENEVPASLGVRKIQWDRSNINQNICYVEPAVSEANPLTCLIHFEHIGKFTFVEEKTFITPPSLPKVPKKKLFVNSWLRNWLVYILIGIVLSLVGESGYRRLSNSIFGNSDAVGFMSLLLIIGIGLVVLGIYANVKYQAIVNHNKRCKQQEKEWNDAWNNWHETIFTYAFQEDINGRLSRIFDAVSACVKQVSEEEFRDALISFKEEETTNMNELEEMIKRRQEEYR